MRKRPVAPKQKPFLAQKVLEYDYSLTAEDGDVFDPHLLVIDWFEPLVRSARAQRAKRAISYRGVRVGSAAVSVDRRLKKAVSLAAANFKPNKEEDKFCSEMNNLGAATKKGYAYAAGVVIAGPTDPEIIKGINYNNIETATLLPCEPCTKGWIGESMVVVTVGGEKHENFYQAYTGKHILESYIKGVKPESPVIEFDPNFSSIIGSRALYLASVAPFSHLEAGTDMMRAEAAVAALTHQA